MYSPRNKLKERKFVVAKKKNKRSESRKEGGKVCDSDSRVSAINVAYENLRASQEGFFKAEGNCSDGGCEVDVEEEDPVPILEGKEGSSMVKRRREKFLEEARKSVPECGKVMHLVKAFEQLLTVPKSLKEGCGEEEEEEEEKVIQWALPGMQPSKKEGEGWVGSRVPEAPTARPKAMRSKMKPMINTSLLYSVDLRWCFRRRPYVVTNRLIATKKDRRRRAETEAAAAKTDRRRRAETEATSIRIYDRSLALDEDCWAAAEVDIATARLHGSYMTARRWR
ncbi:Microtubule-destabilizing protein 60 [Linum perenne]